MVDPLHQFLIHPLIIFHFSGWDLSFTNASFCMVISSVLIISLMYFSVSPRRLVPNRLQMVIELIYDFIKDLIKNTAGREGLPFLPYILSLFLFIAMGNLLGMIPYSFTFTSHIIVTFTLASLVFITVTIVGFFRHGLKFFRFFFPHGVPLYLAPLLVPVEVMSYLARPISLSVRLFANMMAGHAMLKIFAGFIVLLAGSSLFPLALLPLAVSVVLTIFKIFVALLQAYVFTILTCIYLSDALHLH